MDPAIADHFARLRPVLVRASTGESA